LQHGDLNERFGIVRLDPDGTTVRGKRLLWTTQLMQRISKIEERFGVSRHEFDSFAIGRLGAGEVVCSGQDVAEIVVQGRFARRRRKRAAQQRLGLDQVATVAHHQS